MRLCFFGSQCFCFFKKLDNWPNVRQRFLIGGPWPRACKSGGLGTSGYFKNDFARRIRLNNTGPYEPVVLKLFRVVAQFHKNFDVIIAMDKHKILWQ